MIFFSGKYNQLILFAFVLSSSNGNVRENNIEYFILNFWSDYLRLCIFNRQCMKLQNIFKEILKI